MKILEIKIVKAGTDDVVYHEAEFDCGRICTARATLVDIIESVTGVGIDDDDKRDILAFTQDRGLASRFGADWEFYVEAVFMDAEDVDIDCEYDSLADKYTLCL